MPSEALHKPPSSPPAIPNPPRYPGEMLAFDVAQETNLSNRFPLVLSAMSTAAQIRAQIKEVLIQKEANRETLKQLHLQKIHLRRQLNAVKDPVARLPLEVSSEIFTLCLHSCQNTSANTPILLMTVCHEWSNIALSTPTLWATLRIVFPKANSYKEVLSTRLERARNRPLHVSIEFTGPADPNVLSLLWRHPAQLKSLSVFLGPTEHSFAPGIFDAMTPPKLDSLTTLIFRCGTEVKCCHWSYLIRLLRCSPNLIQLGLDNVTPLDMWTDKCAKDLVFPHLRQIIFSQHSDRVQGSPDFLKTVFAPQLQTLYLPISRTDFTHNDFHSLLRRSLPPLQELVLDCSALFGHALTEEALRLIPTLAQLKIISPSLPVMRHFFIVLALPANNSLLPNLVSLKIRAVAPPSESAWVLIQRALKARRKQIKHASITVVTKGKVKMPSQDIVVSLMDLSVTGLHFFLGEAQKQTV
ncbi:hypothetical protein FB45DRAFT_1125683 [Roridomyces roridus]|uniref:F-box domain-containing protein n=1 Tax=Roridomyces roridus TaxID=1738132 RepID=A0AAD7FVQ1_9AGAR|nr:hypothetical protein FB45DRAFT_1125683 [Roridomyces roridus]